MSLSTVYKRKKIAIKCIYSSRKMCLVGMFFFLGWSRRGVRRNGNIKSICSAKIKNKKEQICRDKQLNSVQSFCLWRKRQTEVKKVRKSVFGGLFLCVKSCLFPFKCICNETCIRELHPWRNWQFCCCFWSWFKKLKSTQNKLFSVRLLTFHQYKILRSIIIKEKNLPNTSFLTFFSEIFMSFKKHIMKIKNGNVSACIARSDFILFFFFFLQGADEQHSALFMIRTSTSVRVLRCSHFALTY